MPRNTLKSFPTAMLRRGVAHFHPGAASPGPNLAASDPVAIAPAERAHLATPTVPAALGTDPHPRDARTATAASRPGS